MASYVPLSFDEWRLRVWKRVPSDANWRSGSITLARKYSHVAPFISVDF